jgi:predicted regulator of Ras-like GTPase activity (Roadblock/LC7/MglB family)
MIELLNEISESPGILGAGVYSTQKGIVASNLVKISPSVQQAAGTLLQQIFSLRDATTLNISSFEIQFKNDLILTKKLDPTNALFVLCQTNANLSLVNMSINMLSNDLLHKIKSDHNTQKTSPAAASKQVRQNPPPRSYTEVINGPLTTELKLIKAALSQSIGPFTGIVLEDGINEWLKKGKSQRSELDDLINILAREIEDPKARQRFVHDLMILFEG